MIIKRSVYVDLIASEKMYRELAHEQALQIKSMEEVVEALKEKIEIYKKMDSRNTAYIEHCKSKNDELSNIFDETVKLARKTMKENEELKKQIEELKFEKEHDYFDNECVF